MFDSPLIAVLTIYSGVGLISLASCLIGANVYDIKEAKTRHYIKAHPYAKAHRQKPSISIAIYISSIQDNLSKCLLSIQTNNYRNYEIFVVDDTHRRRGISTKKAIKEFKMKYPNTKIRLLQRRKLSSRTEALAAVIKKWGRGDLVMCLDASSRLDKHALNNVARHFNSSRLNIINPHHHIEAFPSIVRTYQQINHLLATCPKKFLSLMDMSPLTDSSGVTFRRLTGATDRKKTSKGIKYASDVNVYVSPATAMLQRKINIHRQKSNTLYTVMRTPKVPKTPLLDNTRHINVQRTVSFLFTTIFTLLAIGTPLVLSYLLYLAVYFKQSSLYGLSWVIFSIVLFGIIWGSESASVKKRLRLTMFVPVSYNLFYIASVIRLLKIALKPLTLVAKNQSKLGS